MKGTKSNFRAPLVVNFELDYLCDTMLEVIHFQLTYQKTKQRNKKTKQTEKTHCWPMFPFYTPWKHQKTKVFLCFQRGKKGDIGILAKRTYFFFIWKRILKYHLFRYLYIFLLIPYSSININVNFLRHFFLFFYQNINIVAKILPSPNIHLKYLVFLGKRNKYDWNASYYISDNMKQCITERMN